MGIPLSGQGRDQPPTPAGLLPAEQAWLVTLAAPPLAGAAMDAERVYVPVGPRPIDAVPQPGTEQIVALDRETGERRWARDLRSEWPPVVVDGVVYVAAPETIHAVDAVSGIDLWGAALGGRVMAAPVHGAGLLLTVAEGVGLVALRTDGGVQAWALQLDVGAGPTSMIVEREAIYVSLDGGRLVRASLRDGALVWEQKLEGRLGVPAAARDRVLVGSTDNYLYALDPDDGGFEWRYRTGGDVVGAAASGESIFFVALDNVVRGLDRGSGNQRWKSLLDTRAAGPPRVFDRVVLVSGYSPALAEFDARTGAPMGTYMAPSDLVAPALVDPDPRPFHVAIVAIMGDGRAAGLRPVRMMFREPAPAPFQALPGRALDPEQLQP